MTVARPILFSGPMVRALLAGTKTQTRRAFNKRWVKFFNHPDTYIANDGTLWGVDEYGDEHPAIDVCPYGKPGDRLWVRETCRAEWRASGMVDGVHYFADKTWIPIANTKSAADDWVALNTYRGKRGATVPPIHMPRWVSRITLEITEVRVQRLQDISERDAKAEGIHEFGTLGLFGYAPEGTPGPMVGGSTVEAYALLWESINGAGSWAANPWVWCVSFKRVTA